VPFLASMGERDALTFNLMAQKKRQYYRRYIILPSGNELLKLFENEKNQSHKILQKYPTFLLAHHYNKSGLW